MTLKKLTKDESSKPYAEYYYKKLPQIPDGISQKLEEGPLNPHDALRFEDINMLLEPDYLQDEIGYCIMPDGSGFASMLTNMPNISGEMIDWWFVWHPQEALRYKIWFPGAHISNCVENTNKLSDSSLPLDMRYLYNTNYPIEDIGAGIEKIYINFVPPEEFGFDVKRFSKANVATVLCGIVGYPRFNLQHTYMVHIVRNIPGGVELRSRFWLGYNTKFTNFSDKSFVNKIVNVKFIKNLMMKEKIARAMAYHCAQEYHNLAEILLSLYNQYSTN